MKSACPKQGITFRHAKYKAVELEARTEKKSFGISKNGSPHLTWWLVQGLVSVYFFGINWFISDIIQLRISTLKTRLLGWTRQSVESYAAVRIQFIFYKNTTEYPFMQILEHIIESEMISCQTNSTLKCTCINLSTWRSKHMRHC